MRYGINNTLTGGLRLEVEFSKEELDKFSDTTNAILKYIREDCELLTIDTVITALYLIAKSAILDINPEAGEGR